MDRLNPDIISLLNDKVKQYKNSHFIQNDPISIPHQYSVKQDIEIAGFFAALFAWGNRTTILAKSKELMKMMDNSPYAFVLHHQPKNLKPFLEFKHRTFLPDDILFFVHFLHQHYQQHQTLENAFTSEPYHKPTIQEALTHFHQHIFSDRHTPSRTMKHISTPAKNSACKRLCMYLRWMVRKDDVDFGIWKQFKPAQLICPLDIHVSNVALHLGLLNNPKSNWINAVTLTNKLRTIDPKDPVKFDFALFSLGATEGRKK